MIGLALSATYLKTESLPVLTIPAHATSALLSYYVQAYNWIGIDKGPDRTMLN